MQLDFVLLCAFKAFEKESGTIDRGRDWVSSMTSIHIDVLVTSYATAKLSCNLTSMLRVKTVKWLVQSLIQSCMMHGTPGTRTCVPIILVWSIMHHERKNTCK